MMITTYPPTILLGSDPCLIKSIVTLVDKTDEGYIIELVSPAWNDIINMLNKDPGIVHQISPRKWEEIIAGSYEKAGFDEVILTPRSGDLGRDVIAIKNSRGSIRIIDQVKAYSLGHLVTANDVRSLLGVLQADQSATKGVVTTTSDFAPKIHEDKFIKPFIPYRLELINGKQLIENLNSLLKA
jgi:restriction system protein